MSEFYSIGMTCANCGKMLEARISPSFGKIHINGLRHLEYRHDDGMTECIITKSPTAWDGWSATRAFEKSRKRAWAAHDAALAQTKEQK